MRLRVGILDITAAVIVLVVVVLPERSSVVRRTFDPAGEREHQIALYQARLAADPGDAVAAEKLATLLVDAEQTDWAVQVAGQAAAHGADNAWRAFMAASGAHAMRFEVRDARRLAEMAVEACRRSPSACSGTDEIRLELYYRKLDIGVRSGIDPRLDPEGYADAEFAGMRIIRNNASTKDVDDGGSAPE